MEAGKVDKIWTNVDLINWTVPYFMKFNVDSPRLTAELLLCQIQNCSRIELYTNFDRPLSNEELSSYKSLILRRSSGEPLQYITGKVGFFDFEIEVNKSVLIPRPETEQLVSFAFERIKNNSTDCRILDIGTGSGCIAIALAKKLPDSSIIAIDISEEALETAKKNAELNDVRNICFKKIDILTEFETLDKFDYIISNPPYISAMDYEGLQTEILKHEPKSALTDCNDGLDFYRMFSGIFHKLLLDEKSGFFLEIGFSQMDSIREIFDLNGFPVSFKNDLSEISRICYFPDL